ncbi:MAG TPA: ABC transporter substrate-binding protein [Candidatus Binataceae bacterium]|nr:ABC transporter substrate-binding protein [Candidatus Binataceae bacterium]
MSIDNYMPHAAPSCFDLSLRINARRGLAIAIAFAVLIGAGLAPAAVRADSGPMDVTKAMVNRALQILANKSNPLPERRRELRALVEQNFNFRTMSRSALGYNWRSLSPDQRARFTELFTAFIEVAYLDKIQDYSGQRVQFVRERTTGAGYSEVDTNIVGGKSPIPVNYLLEQEDGSWKVYDVTVDAISIIANYRNQFSRVIQEKGFDQLLADLQAKQKQLSSLLGEG